MAKRKQTVCLTAFLKGSTNPKARIPGCSNFDHHYGGCLFGACLLELGERCSYFERAILPTGDSDTRQKYEALTGVHIEGQAVNVCGDCGRTIPPRRRYCDRCVQKRRRATYRQSRQKIAG
jgi:hypothetical protein